MNNKKLLKIITLVMLIGVPFIRLFSMYLETYNIISNYDIINPAIILYGSIPFLGFIYIKNIIDKKRKLNIFDYLIYILIIVGIISTVLSDNIYVSLFGKYYRHEGLLSIVSYYLLFINWKEFGTKEDIKKYIKLLIIISIVNSIYGLLQVYTPFKFIIRNKVELTSAAGFCGHPNFFGSLIVTILGTITSVFLSNKEIKVKDLFVISLLFISLINAQSTGPFLTYGIFLIFLIIFLIIKKKIIFKKVITLVSILLIIYIGIFSINNYVLKFEKCETCKLKEAIETSKKLPPDQRIDITSGRIYIWENSLDIFKKYPIIGVGYDNFDIHYPNPKMESGIKFNVSTNEGLVQDSNIYYIIDNAHNVYLHTLITTGILGLVPYLIMCLLVFIKGLKFKDELGIALLSGFVAYSIQAFANISVIQVAPIYYVIMGLMLSKKDTKKN